MTTQFFERQETQKSYTRWLVWGFVAAILGVVVIIDLIVILGFGGDLERIWRHAPGILVVTSAVVAGVILGASWYKSSQLKVGGAAIARSLGGEPVADNETDLKRKRLVNVVEEMAIAARIRKPQVFVLPHQSGINAFAAGHSPDEAVVAVTQGALEHLDRDQLQAVIGHEFSHILNGDMKINMRLTAWIFGLFVITDLARRMMNGRARGRDAARLKLIALGVFIAGSVGMFAGRLLQAAVSRRREHLADASAVQFTRNPQALQRAFITIAAHAGGSRLDHAASADVAHMFFADSEVSWMNKVGGKWLSTHPPIEERLRAIDANMTPSRVRTLVKEERRKIVARTAAAQAAAEAAGEAGTKAAAPDSTALAGGVALAFADEVATTSDAAGPGAPASGAAASAKRPTGAAPDLSAITTSGLALVETAETRALSEAPATGVRMIDGKPLPPDVLRDRLSEEAQQSILRYLAQVEKNPIAVQALYVAAMLASEPARWRMQLAKLAPALGVELMKETQAQIPRIGQLAPAARLPLLADLLVLLDTLEPAARKRLRAVARAFAPTVAAGDMFRFALTRILDRRLAKTAEASPPVPLDQRAQAVCELYATLAHFGASAGKAGQNAYRAGLMGMLPPPAWLPFPERPLVPASLDAALAGVAQVHPTGKRSFSEGLARVIAVGGRLTVPQVDLLRGICLVVDCPVPAIPADVVFESEPESRPPQANAR